MLPRHLKLSLFRPILQINLRSVIRAVSKLLTTLHIDVEIARTSNQMNLKSCDSFVSIASQFIFGSNMKLLIVMDMNLLFAKIINKYHPGFTKIVSARSA